MNSPFNWTGPVKGEMPRFQHVGQSKSAVSWSNHLKIFSTARYTIVLSIFMYRIHPKPTMPARATKTCFTYSYGLFFGEPIIYIAVFFFSQHKTLLKGYQICHTRKKHIFYARSQSSDRVRSSPLVFLRLLAP